MSALDTISVLCIGGRNNGHRWNGWGPSCGRTFTVRYNLGRAVDAVSDGPGDMPKATIETHDELYVVRFINSDGHKIYFAAPPTMSDNDALDKLFGNCVLNR